MPRARIYQATSLTLQSRIRLDKKASHHVAQVLRAKVGATLTLFNGQGGEYAAEIVHIDKKDVEVEVTAFSPREVESPLDICLAQGIARGEKMDFIVQKAVELGVKKIVPLITARCNIRLDQERAEKRRAHWQAVAISACEQSGRNHIPEICAPVAFQHWLPNAKADQCLLLSPHATGKWDKRSLSVNGSILLLVGPEGGFSEQEEAMAVGQGWLAMPLGPRVLRTETAPLAALAILQAHFGDMLIE